MLLSKPSAVKGVALFALSESGALGKAIGEKLQLELARHEEREFDGGEHKVRALESVRGRSVFIVQSLCGEPGRSANDKLVRLLLFAGALKDAGAARVTACVPYLAYARKDMRTKARDPVSTRYLAELFEAVGISRLLVLEVHNRAAIDNAFRIETLHLVATRLFVEHLAPVLRSTPTCVVSPDHGGVRRARQLQEQLQRRLDQKIGIAFMDKQRSEGILAGDTLVGEVKSNEVIIVDDLISSGSTILRTVAACRAAGAAAVTVATTHCPFTSAAQRLFQPEGPDRIIGTDSVMLPAGFGPYLVSAKLTLVRTAGLFAEAIQRLEAGGSLSDLAGTP